MVDADSQDINKIINHLNELQAYSEALQEQIIELDDSLKAIDEIQSVNDNEEMFVPLTRGVYVKARFVKDDSFLVNVGNKVVAEKKLDDTHKLLEEQKALTEKYLDEILKEISYYYQEYVKLQLGG